jgi:hypothetical protein
MPRSHTTVPTSPKQRSAITNNIYRLGPKIDMRSAAGRRWRDLAAAVVEEFGSDHVEAVRSITGLRFAVEAAQISVVTGVARGPEDLVRLTRALCLKEANLRRQIRDSKAAQPMTLADYLANRQSDSGNEDE